MKRLVVLLWFSSSTAFVVSAPTRRGPSFWLNSQLSVATTPPSLMDLEMSQNDLLKSLQHQNSTCGANRDAHEAPLHSSNDYQHEQQSIPAATGMPLQLQSLMTAPSLTTIATADDATTTAPLSQWQGRLIVLAAAAIFGTNFATVKMLDQVVPTSVSMALRFVLAAVAITTTVAWQHQSQQRRNDSLLQQQSTTALSNDEKASAMAIRNEWIPAAWLGAEVGAWYLIGYLCQSYGLHYVAASKSAFFNSIAVIVVPLLDVLFNGKRLGGKGFVSVGTALAGVALLQFGPALLASANSVASNILEPSSLFAVSQGDLLCLCQAIFFGIGYWRLERASHQYPNQSGPITAAQLVALGIGATAFCGFAGDLPDISVLMQWLTDPFIVKALLWTGLVSTAFALYLETVALRIVSASELTVLMTSVSLWGSAFAFVTMGELMPPIGMAGGLLILGGCILTAMNDGDGGKMNDIEGKELL
ncbi:hypothetical protein MPSEU_000811200 [Mayamaea pseudoterrestris]|nr:hypothetical protein MPSEU_000811200 [Mayamaea pseudoterrestris]